MEMLNPTQLDSYPN